MPPPPACPIPLQEISRTRHGNGPVLFPIPQSVTSASSKEIHDAKGMEGVFESDRVTRGFPHGGGDYFSYSWEWAEESPVEMFDWLIHEGGSDFKERVSAASILFEKWAAKDMEAVLSAVSKIPDTNLRRQALASSLEVLCQSNPSRARELLIQNLDLFPPGLEGSVFKAYGTGKTTCDLLLSLPPGPERTRLLARARRGSECDFRLEGRSRAASARVGRGGIHCWQGKRRVV